MMAAASRFGLATTETLRKWYAAPRWMLVNGPYGCAISRITWR
jgi:hypothetical protein